VKTIFSTSGVENYYAAAAMKHQDVLYRYEINEFKDAGPEPAYCHAF
jgi:hypothetical protein